MSRTNKYLRGLSLGYAYSVITMLVGLWLAPFLLQRIGQQDYGLWLVGTQLLSYLMLADLGIVALLPRETAYATGRAGGVEQATDLPVIIGQTMRIVLYQMPLVALLAAAMWFFMPDAWEPLRKPIAFVLLAFVVVFPLRVLQAVLQGLQDFAFLAAAQFAGWLANLVVTVALVLAGFGLYALAA